MDEGYQPPSREYEPPPSASYISLLMLAVALLAVILTIYGVLRADMLDRFAQQQAQLDRRFGELERETTTIRERQEDVRERLKVLEQECPHEKR